MVKWPLCFVVAMLCSFHSTANVHKKLLCMNPVTTESVGKKLREYGGLGFSAQKDHPKISFTFPLQQFGNVG